jgi:hypothetical protein
LVTLSSSLVMVENDLISCSSFTFKNADFRTLGRPVPIFHRTDLLEIRAEHFCNKVPTLCTIQPAVHPGHSIKGYQQEETLASRHFLPPGLYRRRRLSSLHPDTAAPSSNPTSLHHVTAASSSNLAAACCLELHPSEIYPDGRRPRDPPRRPPAARSARTATCLKTGGRAAATSSTTTSLPAAMSSTTRSGPDLPRSARFVAFCFVLFHFVGVCIWIACMFARFFSYVSRVPFERM